MRFIKKIAKKKIDILIIDTEGSEKIINFCLPDGLSFKVLDIRNHIPFIVSPRFLYNIVKEILIYKYRPVISIFKGIIKETQPLAVLTFIDNNRFMGILQTLMPEILFISIQNGVRHVNEFPVIHEKFFYAYPYYFGFGNYELKLLNKKKTKYKKFFSCGSLNMGIFLSQHYLSNKKSSKLTGISYISQYKESFAKSNDKLHTQFMHLQKLICSHMDRYAKENNESVSVILRSDTGSKTYNDEVSFFKSCFKYSNVRICKNDRSKMTSYEEGMNSKVILSYDSTLMFELLGVGKKILSFAEADSEFANDWGTKNSTSFMPSEIFIDNLEYQAFEDKLRNLIKMSEDVYEDKIRNSKLHYMNLTDKFPHIQIKDLLESTRMGILVNN